MLYPCGNHLSPPGYNRSLFCGSCLYSVVFRVVLLLQLILSPFPDLKCDKSDHKAADCPCQRVMQDWPTAAIEVCLPFGIISAPVYIYKVIEN